MLTVQVQGLDALVRLSMQLREPGASNCLYHIRPDDDADD